MLFGALNQLINTLFPQVQLAGMPYSSNAFQPMFFADDVNGGGGGSEPEEKGKLDFDQLKSKNPDFQKIFDYAVGKASSEVKAKLGQTVDQLREEKKNLLEQYRRMEDDFQGTKEERTNLQKKIDELEEQVLSKEELAQKKIDAERESVQKQMQQLEQGREHFKNNYFSHLKKTAILSHLKDDYDAFDPEQVVALSNSYCEVVEDTDDLGKGLGTYSVKFNWTDPESEKPRKFPFAEGFKLWADQKANDNLFKKRLYGGSDDGKQRVFDFNNGDLPSKIQNLAHYKKHREKYLDQPAG